MTATQLIQEHNNAAGLLARYFEVKTRCNMRGLDLRADEDAFKIVKGDKVLFASDEPDELDTWIDDTSGVAI